MSSQNNCPPCQFSSPLARVVLDSLSAHIAILDEKGIILETNRAWQQYAKQGDLKGDFDSVGSNYLDICDASTGEEAEDAQAVAEGIRLVISGETPEFAYAYPCHGPDGKHWYYMRAVKISQDAIAKAIVSHEDITALKLAEESLKKREAELEEQRQHLEESNIALKVLLKQREQDKLEMEKRFLTNIKETVLPYVQKLKNTRLKPKDKTYVEIIDNRLGDILSPLIQELSAANIFLTPQEMQVASLIKDGKTSKEIADVLNVAETTVHFHRKNLRIKFGLKSRRMNLRSYLMSLS